MPAVLWGLIAVTAGAIFMGVTAWLAAAKSPPLPPDVDLPRTQLQRSALFTLLIGGALAMTAFGIVFVHGPAEVYEHDAPRLTFTFLMLATLGVFTAMLVLARRWSARGDGSMDERDEAILARAHATQGPAILITMAVWTIGLTETFRGVGVPTYFLFFVFWSVLVVHLMALPVGILVGYRRR